MLRRADLIGRILLGLVFLITALCRLIDYPETAGYLDGFGIPLPAVPLFILIELVGGLAILLGYQLRLAALTLTVFTLITAVWLHRDFADPMQLAMFLKCIAVAGGLLLLYEHTSATRPGNA